MAAKLLLTYLSTLVAFLVIDFTWLGFVARDFYQTRLAGLLSTDVNWAAAFIFYALYVIAILVFAVIPAVQTESLQKAILYGAFFGFVAYATYDLTNLATLKDWPIAIVVVDMIWGAVLTGAVATIGYYSGKYFLL